MSNFNCPECNLPQIDTPLGHTTGCAHYRPDWKAVNQTFKELQRTKKVLKELWAADGFIPEPLAQQIEEILNDT